MYEVFMNVISHCDVWGKYSTTKQYLKGHVRSAHGGVSPTEMFGRRTAEVCKQMDEDSRLNSV